MMHQLTDEEKVLLEISDTLWIYDAETKKDLKFQKKQIRLAIKKIKERYREEKDLKKKIDKIPGEYLISQPSKSRIKSWLFKKKQRRKFKKALKR
jgi:hypothetical protein